MTELSFTPVVLPGGGDDETPDTSGVKHPCRVCGQEAGPYKGRGRKPTLCPVHKGATSTSNAPKTKGGNASLAGTAADALCQWNALLVVGCMVTGYHGTGSAIAEREATFREQAYAALVTDPDLCRIILRAGTTSAKLSLLMAYGMLGVSVAPVAVMEFKTKKAEKEAEEEAAA